MQVSVVTEERSALLELLKEFIYTRFSIIPRALVPEEGNLVSFLYLLLISRRVARETEAFWLLVVDLFSAASFG